VWGGQGKNEKKRKNAPRRRTGQDLDDLEIVIEDPGHWHGSRLPTMTRKSPAGERRRIGLHIKMAMVDTSTSIASGGNSSAPWRTQAFP
jgi:hypothetical protein